MIQPGDHIADQTLSAFIDDQLTPEEATAATAHLEACSICRARLDELRSVVSLLRALPDLEAPRDFSIGPRLLVDPPNLVRLRRWYGVARAGAASLAAAFVFLSVGALYVGSQSQATTGAGFSSSQPQLASAPAPATAERNAAAAQSAATPVATAPGVRAIAPAAAAPAPAGAAAARSQPAPTPPGPESADQVKATTSVQALPTPVPTRAPAPAPTMTAVGQQQPVAASRVDSAAPLRTAAAIVGILAALGLLTTLVVRHRLRAASISPTE